MAQQRIAQRQVQIVRMGATMRSAWRGAGWCPIVQDTGAQDAVLMCKARGLGKAHPAAARDRLTAVEPHLGRGAAFLCARESRDPGADRLGAQPHGMGQMLYRYFRRLHPLRPAKAAKGGGRLGVAA